MNPVDCIKNCYSNYMSAVEKYYPFQQQRQQQRIYHRTRQRKRQRHLMMCLLGLMFGVVCLWYAVQSIPRYPWLEVPKGFYRPELIATRHVSENLGVKPLPLGQEDSILRQKIQAELARYPSTLKPHLFYINLQDHRYVNIGGHEAVPAASVIKLPILLAYFRHVDNGAMTPYTHLMYEAFEQADGSGTLQYQIPEQPLLAKDVAQTMIQSSDNTSTNILIYHLGGAVGLNQVFEAMGLSKTYINNWLPDLRGTNVISMADMATILYNIAEGDVLSEGSRQAALEILQGTHNRRLLPALLPPGTVVAHKTGDIGTSLGDSGLIRLPNGQSYILTVQVERPFNDYGAKELIQRISRVVFEDVTSRPVLVTSPSAEDAL